MQLVPFSSVPGLLVALVECDVDSLRRANWRVLFVAVGTVLHSDSLLIVAAALGAASSHER